MAPDTMRVRLHLRLIRVLTVLVDTATRLEIEVTSTRSWSRCPHCGFKTRTVHDRRRRKIRDLPVSGRRTTLVWIRRRFACDNCDERHLETHPEFEGGLTRRLARQLVADAKVMSIRAVVRRHGLDWHLIQALVASWSATVAEHRRSRRCRVLLVDETSMRKRHRYVTVIQDGDTGQILAMVEHRNAAALSGFFIEQGPRWCRGVKVVVSDGSKSYKTAIDTHLGGARHVLDRFHVIRWFAEGLTLVRRDLQRRQPAGVKPAFDPDVFRARFLLLKRGDTLDDDEQARLDALFDTHPRLKAGWDALQELHGLYLADDRDGALAALDRFTDLYATGELPEFHSIVDTVIAWGDQILAWHDTGRPSNGRIEGTNNLLQVLRRVAHGFTNTDNFAARGLLLT
jgi:transposase